MPHVLWQLQGTQRAVFDEHEQACEEFEGFELLRPGELGASDYDDVVRDIVNFLDYIGGADQARTAAARHTRDRFLARVPPDCLHAEEGDLEGREVVLPDASPRTQVKETRRMTVIANRRSVMTLFSKPTDPWSHRTRLVLAEKSITIDIVDVDDGNLPEDLLDLNPYNSVPTLVDRDWSSTTRA